jgi:hypothetical protein
MEDQVLAHHPPAPRPSPLGTASRSRAASQRFPRLRSDRASEASPEVSFFLFFFFGVFKHAFNAVQHSGCQVFVSFVAEMDTIP